MHKFSNFLDLIEVTLCQKRKEKKTQLNEILVRKPYKIDNDERAIFTIVLIFLLLFLCLWDTGLGLLGLGVTDRLRVDYCGVTAVQVLLNFVLLSAVVGIGHTGWLFTWQHNRCHLLLKVQ